MTDRVVSLSAHIEHICAQIGQSGQRNRAFPIPLYPGISLVYLSLHSERLSLCHEPLGRVLEINYCRAGRIGWEMSGGTTVYLGSGDFTVHTMSVCADSVMTFPNGVYEGVTVFVDLDELTAHPPEIIAAAGADGNAIERRLCPDGGSGYFAGNEASERIFEGLFTAPAHLTDAYRRLRVQELLLYLSVLTPPRRSGLSAYRAEQVEGIRRVHEWLLSHLHARVTIEQLSRQFLMNPTTLKAVFRAVYGDSIASHIRTHRMEKAAYLLLHTDDGVADIARSVGYESQSRFTEAFREQYRILPTEYRKKTAVRDTPEVQSHDCDHGKQ